MNFTADLNLEPAAIGGVDVGAQRKRQRQTCPVSKRQTDVPGGGTKGSCNDSVLSREVRDPNQIDQNLADSVDFEAQIDELGSNFRKVDSADDCPIQEAVHLF